MAGYRQTNPDRAKAALAAVIVHAAIGAAFLTGLVVNVSKRPSDVLRTFDITLPPPPPPLVEQKESRAKGDPGEAGRIDLLGNQPARARIGTQGGAAGVERAAVALDGER